MITPITDREREDLAEVQKEVDALTPKERRARLRRARQTDYISLGEALVCTMLRTGKSAVEARNALLGVLASGDVPITGELDGKRIHIPPETFQDKRQ